MARYMLAQQEATGSRRYFIRLFSIGFSTNIGYWIIDWFVRSKVTVRVCQRHIGPGLAG